MTTARFDLVVLGAGSGGFAAARTARQLGASVAMVDHGPLGGLCILRGCMPSKTLLASSDLAQDVREAGTLGINAEILGIDVPGIMARKAGIIGEFADERVTELRKYPLFEGLARFRSPNEVEVGDNLVLEAKNFIIATGSVVAPPPLQGLAETGYIDSDAALEITQLPESLIVLGGGYVACELGQFFARMGVPTTVIVRASHLLSCEDKDIGDALTFYFREEGIRVETNARFDSVERRGTRKVVRFIRDGVAHEVEAAEILFALGRVPNIDGLQLEEAGVDVHPITGITVGADLRTSNPHVFAVGDVTGAFPLVHVAIYQGEVAARNAVSGGAEKADYTLQNAHTIFTDPQVAAVGKNERELQRAGIPYVAGSYPFAEHGKAISIGKTKGFVKMLASPPDGRIIGASIIGPHGSDLIHEMIVAMQYGATAAEFARIPHLHPTLAEIWTYPAEEITAQLEGTPSEATAV